MRSPIAGATPLSIRPHLMKQRLKVQPVVAYYLGRRILVGAA
jgi:hypothetical protein